MTQLSIELVPRSLDSLDAELRTLTQRFPGVRTVNVPDLLRFSLRSWDACASGRPTLPTAIPHLRAMVFAPDRPFVARERETNLSFMPIRVDLETWLGGIL